MLSAKEQMAKIIQEQPYDSSYDEVLREFCIVIFIRTRAKNHERQNYYRSGHN